MWIGDFVRCHSVVTLLREQRPDRPVDMVANSLCAPWWTICRGCGRPSPSTSHAASCRCTRRLAERLRGSVTAGLDHAADLEVGIGAVSRRDTERTGFRRGRFGLINDVRWGERRLMRMIDRCGALALPKGAALPSDWPVPK